MRYAAQLLAAGVSGALCGIYGIAFFDSVGSALIVALCAVGASQFIRLLSGAE